MGNKLDDGGRHDADDLGANSHLLAKLPNQTVGWHGPPFGLLTAMPCDG
jgi:hypothetical protein